MKTILKKYLLYGLLVLPTITNAQILDFVSLQGKQFKLKGEDFYPLSLNYPVSIRYTDDSNGGGPYWVGPDLTYRQVPDDNCQDPQSCYQEMVNELIEIRNMGFNSIRLLGLQFGEKHIGDARKDTGEGPFHPQPDSLYSAFIARHWNKHNPKMVPITAPYTEMFDMISTVLDAAETAGLKVQLLVGGKEIDVRSNRAAYIAYLEAIAAHFADNSTLYSYDFFNEPTWYDNSEFLVDDGYEGFNYIKDRSYDKEEVCDLVKSWNTAIKSNSPKHLTTIGLVGSADIWEWDPGVLNLDFLSFHVYGAKATNYIEYLEETRREIRWFSEACNLPWIIGETAYPAANEPLFFETDSNSNWVLVDPTFEEQKSYAQISLGTVRDYGGSGYTWWQYRDNWEVGFGLLNSDNTHKPVASEFASFDPDGYGGYDNVSHNSYYHIDPSKPYTKYGTVKDQFGNPIPNAIIQQDGHVEYTTFSKSDGKFALHSDFSIWKMRVAALGSSFETNLLNPYNAVLDRHAPDDQVSVVGEMVYNGQEKQYWASQSVTASDTYIESGAGVDMNGEELVKLESSPGQLFTAKRGSFVHIHNDVVRFGCEHYSGYLKPKVQESMDIISGDQELLSKLEGIVVSPNPTNGVFSVKAMNDNSTIYRVEVFDNVGNKIVESTDASRDHTIDISTMASGFYLLRIHSNEGTGVDRVILK